MTLCFLLLFTPMPNTQFLGNHKETKKALQIYPTCIHLDPLTNFLFVNQPTTVNSQWRY